MAKPDGKSAQVLPLDDAETTPHLKVDRGKVPQKLLVDMERVRVRMLAERSPMFAGALNYWRSGLRPIPMKPHDKRPLIKWAEFQDRPPTLAEITQWWKSHPGAWVGIITGQGSNLVVVDVDPRNGGTLFQAGGEGGKKEGIQATHQAYCGDQEESRVDGGDRKGGSARGPLPHLHK